MVIQVRRTCIRLDFFSSIARTTSSKFIFDRFSSASRAARSCLALSRASSFWRARSSCECDEKIGASVTGEKKRAAVAHESAAYSIGSPLWPLLKETVALDPQAGGIHPILGVIALAAQVALVLRDRSVQALKARKQGRGHGSPFRSHRSSGCSGCLGCSRANRSSCADDRPTECVAKMQRRR